MEIFKNKKVTIAMICFLIVAIALGYSVLTQLLQINGTSSVVGDFKIEFTKIEEGTMVNSKTITTGGIGSTTANFTVDLKKPGSSAVYDVTVENKGSIDAILTSITGLDESNEKEPVDIIYSIDGIKEGDPLNAGEEKTFQVKVVWKVSATTIPTTSKSLTLKLNYEQQGDGNIITPASCFTINDQGTITGYTCEDKEVVIPSEINSIKVTSIGENALADKNITSVVIPNGVTTIEGSAFNYSSLESVKIPNSVTKIEDYAFANNQLTSVELPANLTSINYFAFQNNQLTSIVIPDSVKTIGSNAFAYNKLTELVIPNSVVSIGSDAFANNLLTSVVIPDSVTSIEYRAFATNQLNSVILSKNLTTIDNGTFFKNKLVSIEIPEGVTSIGDTAFSDNQLASVSLPVSLTSIEYDAFSNNQLTQIEIPQNVTKIGAIALYNNPNLTTIINKTGRAFDWYDITRKGKGVPAAVTGTYGTITVKAE